MKSWRDSCGTVVFYVNQVRGFLKYTLHNRGGARVFCPGCVCLWREVDSVEVSRQGGDPCWCGVWRFDVNAVPVGRYRVLYCMAVDV